MNMHSNSGQITRKNYIHNLYKNIKRIKHKMQWCNMLHQICSLRSTHAPTSSVSARSTKHVFGSLNFKLMFIKAQAAPKFIVNSLCYFCHQLLHAHVQYMFICIKYSIWWWATCALCVVNSICAYTSGYVRVG